jgi:hypothetical protein
MPLPTPKPWLCSPRPRSLGRAGRRAAAAGRRNPGENRGVAGFRGAPARPHVTLGDRNGAWRIGLEVATGVLANGGGTRLVLAAILANGPKLPLRPRVVTQRRMPDLGSE